MIFMFEIDVTKRRGRRFRWRPAFFRGSCQGNKTWRMGWGIWSLAYYPVKGVREFFSWVKDSSKWVYEPSGFWK